MTALPVIEHDARIIRRQAGPFFLTQFCCSCGCASPAAINKDVAIIARRSHLTDIGKAGEGDD